MSSNEISKMKRAEYYVSVIQNELDNFVLSGDKTESEYNEKCSALINQHLYVDAKVIDVIEYEKHLEERVNFLEEKKGSLINQIDSCVEEIHRAKSALKEWMKDNKKVEVDEYILSLRPSKSIEIVDESLIPEMFWNEKIVRTISKTKIKEAFDNGETVPGAILKENTSLQIKD